MTESIFSEDRYQTRWGSMYIRRAGSGPPIVMVHGLGVSGTYFQPAARLLSRDFQVMIPDLPGSGRSSKPHHVLNVTELADVLADWIRSRQILPPHWVGNSFGCQIVIELAVRHPDLVNSVILLGPTIEAQARTTIQQLFRLAVDAAREPFSEIFIALFDYIRFGPRRFWKTFVIARDDRIEEKLWKVKAPSIVIHGERDPIVPLHWAEFVTGLLPGARLENVVGAAHTVHYSHPEEFARIVTEFIQTSFDSKPGT